VPAHLDVASGTYVLDVPFPSNFDAAEKRWRFEEGAVGWDQVLVRWKGRGPMNDEYVRSLQRGWSVSE
jgi:ring-1,2-phenylacetyl-CoA epoxidase subunit PaaA